MSAPPIQRSKSDFLDKKATISKDPKRPSSFRETPAGKKNKLNSFKNSFAKENN